MVSVWLQGRCFVQHWCAVSSVQCCSMWYTVCGAWCTVYSVRCMMQYLVCGAWYAMCIPDSGSLRAQMELVECFVSTLFCPAVWGRRLHLPRWGYVTQMLWCHMMILIHIGLR